MNKLLFSLAANGKSAVEEMWDYFVENYLSGSREYPNLGLTENSILSVPVILAGLIIGALVAVIAASYDNRVTGGFVRGMLEKGAVGREKSLTLADMGLTTRSSIARALRKSVGLRRIVRCIEEEDFYRELDRQREEYEKKREEDASLPRFKEEGYTFTGSEHFYIPEDKKATAEVKHANRGTKAWSFPITIVVCVIVFFALAFILPYILTLADQLVGSFKSV